MLKNRLHKDYLPSTSNLKKASVTLNSLLKSPTQNQRDKRQYKNLSRKSQVETQAKPIVRKLLNKLDFKMCVQLDQLKMFHKQNLNFPDLNLIKNRKYNIKNMKENSKVKNRNRETSSFEVMTNLLLSEMKKQNSHLRDRLRYPETSKSEIWVMCSSKQAVNQKEITISAAMLLVDYSQIHIFKTDKCLT